MEQPQECKPSSLTLLSRGFDGSLLWRNWFPINQLRRKGYTADWLYMDDYIKDVRPAIESGKYNVVITPRFIFREKYMLKSFMRTLEQNNITWIYDLDDDTLTEDIVPRQIAYWLKRTAKYDIPEEEREKQIWAGHEYERAQRQELLEVVDGVTVSTDHLADVAKKYTSKPVFVIPNAIDTDWYQERLYGSRTVPPISIGWSGGWRLDDDFEIMAQAWAEIARLYPSVNFVISGYASPLVLMAIPADRLKIFDWVEIDVYPYILTNIDIGCCAVSDVDWNLNKSPIKWIEMTMSGAACVTSRSLYGDYLIDGVDGLLASSVDQWVKALSTLVEDDSVRELINKSARQTIKDNYTVVQTYPMWIRAWQSIMSQKHARTS